MENDHKRALKFIREVTLTTSTLKRSPFDPCVVNDFLAGTMTAPIRQNLTAIESCDREDSFSFKSLQVEELRQLLHSVQTDTVTGQDGISGYLVKSLAYEIVPNNITKILNASVVAFQLRYLKASKMCLQTGKAKETNRIQITEKIGYKIEIYRDIQIR